MTKTYQLGVLGYPLGHSLSVKLQSYFLSETGLLGEYSKLEVPPADLNAWIADVSQSQRLNGFNVTIPHKVKVMAHMTHVSEDARLIGAVNTVRVTSEGLYGYNTDCDGFRLGLGEVRSKLMDGAHVLLIGAGGSSRAVAYTLLRLGVSRMTFLVRSLERAATTADAITKMSEAVSPNVSIHWQTAMKASDMNNITLLVNTTPVGMHPDTHHCPFDVDLLDALPSEATVYDLVYNPIETELLKFAADRGLDTQDGLDMLVGQGAEAFRLWTGQMITPTVFQGARARLEDAIQTPKNSVTKIN